MAENFNGVKIQICVLAGLEVKLKNMLYPVIVAPTHIAELRAISHTDKGVKFGASVTLTRIDEELKEAIQKYPGIYRSYYVPPSDCCPHSYS